MSITLHSSSLFKQSFSILKVIPRPRVSNANLFVGDFPCSSLKPPGERASAKGSWSWAAPTPVQQQGRRGHGPGTGFLQALLSFYSFPPPNSTGDASPPLFLQNGMLAMFRAREKATSASPT